MFMSVHLIRAASELARAQQFDAAYIDETYGGKLTLYSYEGFSDSIPRLAAIAKSIAPHINIVNGQWYFELFCLDGFLACTLGGQPLDSEGEPIEGGNIFDEYQKEV